jgi:antagonist of KipI
MKFLKAGIFTSFQNNGNYGLQDRGIPVGGAMDLFSFSLLNIILHNSINETSLELHYPAPHILFEEDTIICITGADFGAKLDNKSIFLNKEYKVNAGSELRFSNKIWGERAYFGCKNGFNIKTNCKIPEYQKITDGFEVSLNKNVEFEILASKFGVSLRQYLFDSDEFEILFVPQNEYFDFERNDKDKLLNNVFKISNASNRMGIRLTTENPFSFSLKKEMISVPVSKGTIQLPSDGNPVILMSDAQVTGGYYRIGFVPTIISNQISQLKSGTKIKFKPISLEKALELKEEESYVLNRIKRYIEIGKKVN